MASSAAVEAPVAVASGFHSISFPSEWGAECKEWIFGVGGFGAGFHSISFPSEWGAGGMSEDALVAKLEFPFN